MDETAAPRAEDEPSANTISRRRVLTQIGAGVAIAWAAPIIKSIPAYASTSGSPPPLCPQCGPFNPCDQTPVCGHDPNSDADCVCVERVEDPNCTCYNNLGVCKRNRNICATDADCIGIFGAGYQCLRLKPSSVTCMSAFCGTATTMCGAPCNSGLDKNQLKTVIRKKQGHLGLVVAPPGP